MRRLALLLLLAFAQGQEFKIVTTTNLVVVDVTVQGRDGKPAENLKAEDFRVFEDGKPQAVSVFEFQKLDAEPLATAPPPLSKSLYVQPEEKPESKEDNKRFQNRRLLVLFFDFTSMRPPDQVRAQQAALKFLQEQMTAADLVAIMTFSTRLKLEQDFTDDREALGEVVRSFRIGEMSELAEQASTGAAEGEDEDDDTNTLFLADDTEFNIFNTDRKLSALEAAVETLASLPERKALVYFSSGVAKTGVENQSQLRSTVNAAVRANVAFYPIDVRGLMALPPGGDASQPGARGTAIYSGAAHREQKLKFNDEQETLDTLAGDTGGKALLDSNDLNLGITQAQKDIRSYYIVGYYSTNPAQDGRFRKIQVRLPPQPRARLEYRPGYYAPKEYKYFTAADKERQLEDALQSGDPVTDLPVALETDHFRLPNNRYFVPVAVKIPGAEIAADKKGAEFDFIGQVRDAKKKLVGGVRDTIRVKLSDADAERLKRRYVVYDTGFVLASGEYRVKFLARDNQSGKMGTFESRFTVPDLNNENTAVRVSSIVWSSQREPVAAAIGSAEQSKKERDQLLGVHPLVEGGQKLIPSITRVFRREQNLYVYFEVYDPARTDEAASVAASLTFLRGRSKILESAPLRLTQPLPNRPNTLAFHFTVPLKKLQPGRYTCQVNVIDELGRKFAFRRAGMVVLR